MSTDQHRVIKQKSCAPGLVRATASHQPASAAHGRMHSLPAGVCTRCLRAYAPTAYGRVHSLPASVCSSGITIISSDINKIKLFVSYGGQTVLVTRN
jgi:hypothetical protein